MEPSSAAISREVASAVGAMAVTPSNVLQVHNALQAESERLSAKLKLHQPALRVGEAGKDPVSGPAAAVFNAKIASLVDGCWAYIHALSEAAENLRATARDYGYTEDQIKTSFDAHKTTQHADSDRRAAISQLPDPIRATLEPTPPPGPALPGMFR
jgi:uncharacterized protein YukE